MNAKANGASGTVSKSKKNQPAPTDLISAVGKLFDIAAKQSVPMQLKAMTRDKLYEMFVLMRLLHRFKRGNPKGKIVHIPPSAGGKANHVVMAGKPALANRSMFSHFDLYDDLNQHVGEAWSSVEFESLSWHKDGGHPGKAPRVARHELDVCILRPNAGLQPTHDDVFAGVSCKDVRKATKENVREALGLRRETAYLKHLSVSRAPWLITHVPADPASPILLVSSHTGVTRYRSPVDAMGVYVRYMRRPWKAEF